MLAKLHTFSLFGIDARPVEVEVDISPAALPKTILVGLAETAVKESVHRVERALVNSGYTRPMDRVVINLSPADLPKDAGSFDLPISLGLLAASGQFQSERFADYACVGELALDGTLRPVKGALSMALAARELGRKGLLVPVANAQEAAVVDGIEVFAVGTLTESVGFFTEQLPLEPVQFSWREAIDQHGRYDVDYSDVKGQEAAKRAAVVAGAGSHHLLMIGSPGTGKTLLARRMASILPRLSQQESLETTRIWSAVGRLEPGQPLILLRPFRSPHHTVSEAGLVGGGSTPAPGEISLAHHGVLFLDELPEFKRSVLETMRQPLEEGRVTISRAAGTMTFPSQFMLVAAMNPTPDGKMPGESKNSPREIQNYLGRISGPLLDRIDLHVEVPPVKFREISGDRTGETSAEIRRRVMAARVRQQQRFAHKPKITCNARMATKEIKEFCALDEPTKELLKQAMAEYNLTARAYDRILKVARTIADLAAAETITSDHISEAIQLRSLDRQLWG